MKIKIKCFITALAILAMMPFTVACRSENDEDFPVSTSDAAGAGRVTTQSAEPKPSESGKGKRVCIDPGHGFSDPGSSSEYIGDLTEKDINIDFSKILERELSRRGYDVFLTHDGESFPKTDKDDGNDIFNIKERIAYFNSVGADYFLSIHCNTYAGTKDVNGVRIYFCEDSQVPVKQPQTAAKALCEALEEAFPDYKKPMSEMTPADDSYYVTHWAKSCALLIEIGYLTNKTDAENMLSTAWQEKMAVAVANGIDKYFEEQ